MAYILLTSFGMTKQEMTLRDDKTTNFYNIVIYIYPNNKLNPRF